MAGPAAGAAYLNDQFCHGRRHIHSALKALHRGGNVARRKVRVRLLPRFAARPPARGFFVCFERHAGAIKDDDGLHAAASHQVHAAHAVHHEPVKCGGFAAERARVSGLGWSQAGLRTGVQAHALRNRRLARHVLCVLYTFADTLNR